MININNKDLIESKENFLKFIDFILKYLDPDLEAEMSIIQKTKLNQEIKELRNNIKKNIILLKLLDGGKE